MSFGFVIQYKRNENHGVRELGSSSLDELTVDKIRVNMRMIDGKSSQNIECNY